MSGTVYPVVGVKNPKLVEKQVKDVLKEKKVEKVDNKEEKKKATSYEITKKVVAKLKNN